ncbi:MAG: hypothetical protein OEQ28_09945 [Acidobacteriota bacterium]|nr:hypothetical protein [Acidobacteriota bacterium]
MKNETKKIKVIKKSEIGRIKKPIVKKRDSADFTTKRTVATITAWIDELQQRRSEEAKSAIEQLNRPQPITRRQERRADQASLVSNDFNNTSNDFGSERSGKPSIDNLERKAVFKHGFFVFHFSDCHIPGTF